MAGIYVGCAGWSLRNELAAEFPASGTHLQRYAQRFGSVEINSSFYRPHRHATYQRWAASTPPEFRFAVKMPKQITHVKRLVDAAEPLERLASEVSGLGEKLGGVLVQLPPSLRFQRAIAERFFEELRSRLAGSVAFEPRHASWFEPEVEAMLAKLEISRVAADPSVVPAAAEPGGSHQLVYFRWHGSPRIYYSAYDTAALKALAARLLAAVERGTAQVWCIFDNTAEGEATRNALELMTVLQQSSASSWISP